MGKRIPTAAYDAYLQGREGSHIHFCSAEPANFAGVAAVSLASQAIAGSYALANGDVSGRKNTVPAQTEVPISASGLCNHVVIVHNATSDLRLVTTCDEQALTSGGTLDSSAFAHELRDPS